MAQFTQWKTEWPVAGEGRTDYRQLCPPSGIPFVWGYQHRELRSYEFVMKPSHCPSTASYSQHSIERHYFYYCADSENYEIFQPPYTPPEPMIPACRLKTGKHDPEKQPHDDCCNFGNPINIATGKKYHRESVYSGASVFPLTFDVHYTGEHWSHSFSRSIVALSPSVIYVDRADGQRFTFLWNGSQFTSDADVSTKLERVAVGGVFSGWKYRDTDDSVETYDTSGRLVAVSNRSGRTHSLSYDSVSERFTGGPISMGA